MSTNKTTTKSTAKKASAKTTGKATEKAVKASTAETPNGIAGRVMAALTEGRLEDLTAASIAERAGIGRSTATKTLRNLEGQGLVARTKGGHDGTARQADQWYATASTTKPKAGKKPAPTKPAAKKAATATVTPAAGGQPGDRLGKGELRQMVYRLLADSPDRELGPSQLAKVLDRSAGAVANALDKLAENGLVELTNDKPRRYRVTQPIAK